MKDDKLENTAKNKKLSARDAIQIGLYAALLFFISGLVGSIGFIPVLYPVAPFVIGVVCGPVFFLFLSKVRFFGMITAVGTLQGAFLAITGHGLYSLLASIVLGLIADIICRMGNYRSFKHALLGYAFYALIMATSYFPMIFSAETFYANVENSMSAEYAHQLRDIMHGSMFIVVFVGAFVGGIIGAFLGRAVARRHFQRSQRRRSRAVK
ncbi:MAG: MptD family putative ECF transporter S component [Saccharofermentanales bacterium]|jgi:energy-coupling factor transport system substrate-specific component